MDDWIVVEIEGYSEAFEAALLKAYPRLAMLFFDRGECALVSPATYRGLRRLADRHGALLTARDRCTAAQARNLLRTRRAAAD